MVVRSTDFKVTLNEPADEKLLWLVFCLNFTHTSTVFPENLTNKMWCNACLGDYGMFSLAEDGTNNNLTRKTVVVCAYVRARVCVCVTTVRLRTHEKKVTSQKWWTIDRTPEWDGSLQVQEVESCKSTSYLILDAL